MLTRLRGVAVVFAVLVASFVPAWAATEVSITTDATFVDAGLSATQAQILPAYPIANDHGIKLGGIGSDLYHMPGDAADIFWAVTDRGPNGEVEIDGETRPTAFAPEFTPTIMKVKVANGVVTPIEFVPITTATGKPVTGLPNIPQYDVQFWDATGTTKLDYNPNGLDTEGLVRTSNGDFWIADEYSPSLVHINAKGNVIARYVPKGLKLTGADYPVIEALPAAYTLRKGNRGFEGLSITEDGKTIFIVLQSPLSAPDKKVGDRSRTTRIVKFDVATAKVTGEYAYTQEIAAIFNPREKIKQTDMKLSGVAAIDGENLLVLERTDWAFAIYKVNLTQATNLVGSGWSDTNTPVSLEFFASPADVNVNAVSKTLIVHSDSLSNMPNKVEGLTIVNNTTLAIANDNDFGVSTVDANGNNIDTGVKCRVLVMSVPDITK